MAVFSYPASISELYGYDKWMLFTVKSGRHILRSRTGMSAEKQDTPVNGAPMLKLYLPATALASSLGLSWNEGTYGNIIGAALQGSTSVAQNIQNVFKTMNTKGSTGDINSSLVTAGKSLLDAVGGASGALIADAAFEAAEKLGIEDAAEKFGGVMGLAPNPRTDIFFTSVKYRTHSFTWDLIPRNQQEAKNIDVILNAFQFYSLPSFGDNTDESAFFMGYPYEWRIQMFSETNGSKHHINTIDDSVVTNIAINHSSNDRVSFIVDGELKYYPVYTKLTVDMQEVRLQGRNDQDVIWRGLTTTSDARPNSNDLKSNYPE